MSKVPEKGRQGKKRFRTQLIHPDYDYNNLTSTGMSLMLQVVNICVRGACLFSKCNGPEFSIFCN